MHYPFATILKVKEAETSTFDRNITEKNLMLALKPEGYIHSLNEWLEMIDSGEN